MELGSGAARQLQRSSIRGCGRRPNRGRKIRIAIRSAVCSRTTEVGKNFREQARASWSKLKESFPEIDHLFGEGSRPDTISVDPKAKTIRLFDPTSRPHADHLDKSARYLDKLLNDPAIQAKYDRWRVNIREQYWESGFRSRPLTRSGVVRKPPGGGSTSGTPKFAMTASPLSPRLLKGALVAVDLASPIPTVIVFQYNPETLTRQLKARGDAGRGREGRRRCGSRARRRRRSRSRSRSTRPTSSKRATAIATTVGIYPQLSALEMLVYPKSALVIANTALLAGGHDRGRAAGRAVDAVHLGREAHPAGARRASSASPRRRTTPRSTRSAPRSRWGCACSATTTCRITNPGYYMFLAHQVVKETMAVDRHGRNNAERRRRRTTLKLI